MPGLHTPSFGSGLHEAIAETHAIMPAPQFDAWCADLRLPEKVIKGALRAAKMSPRAAAVRRSYAAREAKRQAMEIFAL